MKFSPINAYGEQTKLKLVVNNFFIISHNSPPRLCLEYVVNKEKAPPPRGLLPLYFNDFSIRFHKLIVSIRESPRVSITSACFSSFV